MAAFRCLVSSESCAQAATALLAPATIALDAVVRHVSVKAAMGDDRGRVGCESRCGRVAADEEEGWGRDDDGDDDGDGDGDGDGDD
jgi:hypothetical protein